MARPAPEITNVQPTDCVGAHLRARRELAGLNFAQVSAQTNLRVDYIQAIESMNAAALPEIGYVLGYVRTYAESLGLDGPRIVARYKTDAAVGDTLIQGELPHFVFHRKIRLPRGMVASVTLIGFATMLGVWYGTQTQVEAEPLTNIARTADIPVEPLAPTLTANLLTLRLTAPSWVEIRNADGQRLVSRIFVTGESWQGARDQNYTVSVRDAGAVELFYGADSAGPLGPSGQPLENISLTDNVLQQ